MKYILAAFVFFATAATAHAADFCDQPRHATSDFCDAIKKSEEALQKVRELVEKSKQIQEEVDRQLEQKRKEMQKK